MAESHSCGTRDRRKSRAFTVLGLASLAICVYVGLAVYRLFKTSELIHAIYSGDRQQVVRLLDSGTDVNAANLDGFTPLMRAVSAPRSDVDLIRLLLSRGARIDVKDSHGVSVLEHAAFNEAEELIRQAERNARGLTPAPAAHGSPTTR